MKQIFLFALPFAFLACGDSKKANGEHCTADDDCERGFCHIMDDESANHCMNDAHDDMGMGDSGEM